MCLFERHEADLAAILPLILLYEADSAAILPFILLYEADSDAMLHDFLLYEADHAATIFCHMKPIMLCLCSFEPSIFNENPRMKRSSADSADILPCSCYMKPILPKSCPLH